VHHVEHPVVVGHDDDGHLDHENVGNGVEHNHGRGVLGEDSVPLQHLQCSLLSEHGALGLRGRPRGLHYQAVCVTLDLRYHLVARGLLCKVCIGPVHKYGVVLILQLKQILVFKKCGRGYYEVWFAVFDGVSQIVLLKCVWNQHHTATSQKSRDYRDLGVHVVSSEDHKFV